jgi:hypothetical protein
VVVLDSSVLMEDPQACLAYPGSRIVIPMTVFDELDNNKTGRDVAGRNAHNVLRAVEALRLQSGGSITTPVELPDYTALVVTPPCPFCWPATPPSCALRPPSWDWTPRAHTPAPSVASGPVTSAFQLLQVGGEPSLGEGSPQQALARYRHGFDVDEVGGGDVVDGM